MSSHVPGKQPDPESPERPAPASGETGGPGGSLHNMGGASGSVSDGARTGKPEGYDAPETAREVDHRRDEAPKQVDHDAGRRPGAGATDDRTEEPERPEYLAIDETAAANVGRGADYG